jgi:hypothetical protein
MGMCVGLPIPFCVFVPFCGLKKVLASSVRVG